MARVKRSVNAQKKRRTTLESAAGYRGQRSRLYRKAKEQGSGQAHRGPDHSESARVELKFQRNSSEVHRRSSRSYLAATISWQHSYSAASTSTKTSTRAFAQCSTPAPRPRTESQPSRADPPQVPAVPGVCGIER